MKYEAQEHRTYLRKLAGREDDLTEGEMFAVVIILHDAQNNGDYDLITLASEILGDQEE